MHNFKIYQYLVLSFKFGMFTMQQLYYISNVQTPVNTQLDYCKNIGKSMDKIRMVIYFKFDMLNSITDSPYATKRILAVIEMLRARAARTFARLVIRVHTGF